MSTINQQENWTDIQAAKYAQPCKYTTTSNNDLKYPATYHTDVRWRRNFSKIVGDVKKVNDETENMYAIFSMHSMWHSVL